jgi:hypothetical protein
VEVKNGMKDVTGKSYTPTSKPSDTLVIHCVDHRFQEAFRKFIVGELGIEVFNPIVIAGGALAVGSDHFEKFGYIWDQVDLFVKEKGINRIILVNHEDCAWYKHEHPGLNPDELKDLGRSDLSRAAANIRDKHPGVELMLFWAELSGDSIRFDQID